MRTRAPSDAPNHLELCVLTLLLFGIWPVADASPGAGESPQATLGRIRAFAPTAAKLAESGGEYLATIKARRQEEVAGRKEREVR
jgi:hypothetical protein